MKKGRERIRRMISEGVRERGEKGKKKSERKKANKKDDFRFFRIP